jgi:DNA-binding NarL/FixJ family response regulator
MASLVIAEDHTVIRQALSDILQTRGKFQVIGQAGDGEELLSVLNNNKPDIVIMDLNMPRLDGLATLERLKANNSTVPVLILSADEGERNVRMAMNAGARGYISKNAGVDELEFALDSILAGKVYLSPAVTSALVKSEGTPDPLAVLSKRELEILTHLAEGRPNREIAKILHISTRTVDTHRSNILKKLNLKTNAELVKLAIAYGLVRI